MLLLKKVKKSYVEANGHLLPDSGHPAVRIGGG